MEDAGVAKNAADPIFLGKDAALRFMTKPLKRHGSPEAITTAGLRSYGAAMKELGWRSLAS